MTVCRVISGAVRRLVKRVVGNCDHDGGLGECFYNVWSDNFYNVWSTDEFNCWNG